MGTWKLSATAINLSEARACAYLCICHTHTHIPRRTYEEQQVLRRCCCWRTWKIVKLWCSYWHRFAADELINYVNSVMNYYYANGSVTVVCDYKFTWVSQFASDLDDGIRIRSLDASELYFCSLQYFIIVRRERPRSSTIYMRHMKWMNIEHMSTCSSIFFSICLSRFTLKLFTHTYTLMFVCCRRIYKFIIISLWFSTAAGHSRRNSDGYASVNHNSGDCAKHASVYIWPLNHSIGILSRWNVLPNESTVLPFDCAGESTKEQ